MSPTYNRSFAFIQHFENGNVIEMHNRIMFNFYLGLPHVVIVVPATHIDLYSQFL